MTLKYGYCPHSLPWFSACMLPINKPVTTLSIYLFYFWTNHSQGRETLSCHEKRHLCERALAYVRCKQLQIVVFWIRSLYLRLSSIQYWILFSFFLDPSLWVNIKPWELWPQLKYHNSTFHEWGTKLSLNIYYLKKKSQWVLPEHLFGQTYLQMLVWMVNVIYINIFFT